MATGLQIINGRSYQFREDGILDGFVIIDGKKYYFNPDGSKAIGVQNIADKYLLFDENGVFQGNATTAKIIDVSYHNGNIDWNKVKATGEIYGVIVRIGYWNIEDKKFSEYIEQIKQLEIPYGIYLFSYAEDEIDAKIEADFTNSIIDKYNLKPSLGIYYDLESWTTSTGGNSYGITANQYDNIAKKYIDTVSSYNRNRFKVKVYANLYYATKILGPYSSSQVDWIAQYNDHCTYNGMYSMWQYTSSGKINGINGNVDMSVLYIKN